MSNQFNYVDITHSIPGDDGFDTLRLCETNPERTELYRAVAELRTDETEGKWYFCQHGGYRTLIFPLGTHHIGEGGIFGDRYVSDDANTLPKGKYIEGAQEVLSKMHHSDAIHAEVYTLLRQLIAEGFDPNTIYEYDPLGGGIGFTTSQRSAPFNH